LLSEREAQLSADIQKEDQRRAENAKEAEVIMAVRRALAKRALARVRESRSRREAANIAETEARARANDASAAEERLRSVRASLEHERGILEGARMEIDRASESLRLREEKLAQQEAELNDLRSRE